MKRERESAKRTTNRKARDERALKTAEGMER